MSDHESGALAKVDKFTGANDGEGFSDFLYKVTALIEGIGLETEWEKCLKGDASVLADIVTTNEAVRKKGAKCTKIKNKVLEALPAGSASLKVAKAAKAQHLFGILKALACKYMGQEGSTRLGVYKQIMAPQSKGSDVIEYIDNIETMFREGLQGKLDVEEFHRYLKKYCS